MERRRGSLNWKTVEVASTISNRIEVAWGEIPPDDDAERRSRDARIRLDSAARARLPSRRKAEITFLSSVCMD
jgi:hypothetical protein